MGHAVGGGAVAHPDGRDLRRFAVDLHLRVGAARNALTTFGKAAYLDLGRPRPVAGGWEAEIGWQASTATPLFPVFSGWLKHWPGSDAHRWALCAPGRGDRSGCGPRPPPPGRKRDRAVGAGRDRPGGRGSRGLVPGWRLAQVALGDEGSRLRTPLKIQLRQDAADIVLHCLAERKTSPAISLFVLPSATRSRMLDVPAP